jgi:hypothetical protein
MGTLSARNLTEALSHARNIGLVEESFVLGDISVVVRNLRPDQYDSIFKECQGLADVEYLNAWQMGHVTRAICEINGLDLRDVTVVEDEEPDPKRQGQMRVVKQELHTWLRKQVLSTWSRESIYICYRKVADAIEAGEKKAQDGVAFRIPDESPEDKYRRLLGELKEVEEEVPEKILDAVLRENGMMRRSTQEEIDAAAAKLAQVDVEPMAANPDPVVPEPSRPSPEPVRTSEPEQPTPEPRRTAGPPSPDRMAQLLRNRVPMNQGVSSETVQPVQQEQVPPLYVEPTRPAPPAHAVPQTALTGRSAEAAALEGGLDALLADMANPPVNLQPQTQRPEVRVGSNPKLDPQAAQAILDAPPVGGINPRFRPPTL